MKILYLMAWTNERLTAGIILRSAGLRHIGKYKIIRTEILQQIAVI